MPIKRQLPAEWRRFLNPAAALRWWGDGLLLWLPPSLRQRLMAPPPRMLIDLLAEEIVISEQTGEASRELIRYPRALLADGLPDAPRPQQRQIVLRLPLGQALIQTITLPQAAAANLHRVVGFELDRLTPFPVDKIYYDACVVAQQPATRSVQVQFAMVLRATLDPLLEQLRATGLMPDRVVVAAGDSGCNLLPAGQQPRRASLAGRLRMALLLLIVLTGLAALAFPLWQQRSLVVALIPRVKAAQQQAAKVAGLRRQLDTAVESSRFLLDKRQHRPRVIDVLNELTRVIPDNTWLEQLQIRGNQIELHGQSQEASALLQLVENSPLFQGATFRSPITRDRRSGEERFYLVAQIIHHAGGS